MNARTETARTVVGLLIVSAHDHDDDGSTGGASAIPVRVEMRHFPADPLAAHVTFHHGGDEIPWVFDLGLLDAGRRGEVGLGDVRIWPGTESGVAAVYLSLSSPEGEALIELPIADVTAFVDAAFVSMGGRADELLAECVETALAAILAEGGGSE